MHLWLIFTAVKCFNVWICFSLFIHPPTDTSLVVSKFDPHTRTPLDLPPSAHVSGFLQRSHLKLKFWDMTVGAVHVFSKVLTPHRSLAGPEVHGSTSSPESGLRVWRCWWARSGILCSLRRRLESSVFSWPILIFCEKPIQVFHPLPSLSFPPSLLSVSVPSSLLLYLFYF